jgi:hypothetical protein
VQSDKVNELLRIYRDSIEGAGRQQKGFVGASMGVDTGTGEGFVQLYWETEADMLAEEKSGRLLEQFAKAAPILAAPLALEHHEVVLPEAKDCHKTLSSRILACLRRQAAGRRVRGDADFERV